MASLVHSQRQGSADRANGDTNDMLLAWLVDNYTSGWAVCIHCTISGKKSAHHSGIKSAMFSDYFLFLYPQNWSAHCTMRTISIQLLQVAAQTTTRPPIATQTTTESCAVYQLVVSAVPYQAYNDWRHTTNTGRSNNSDPETSSEGLLRSQEWGVRSQDSGVRTSSPGRKTHVVA